MKQTTARPLGRIGAALRLAAVLTLAVAAILMMGSLLGGLGRMGVETAAMPVELAQYHGPLMVSAFFGALISMERAVALRRAWSLVAPMAAAAGGVSLVATGDQQVASIFFVVAGATLMWVFATLLWRRWENFTFVMSLGALAWAMGNLLWALGQPVWQVTPWWAAFFVLTIAGERLELSRFRKGRRRSAGFWFGVALVAIGLVWGLLELDRGLRLVGLGFVVVAIWLARHDVAHATIRLGGGPQYMAVALFAGYFWLAATGGLAIFYGPVSAGVAYDLLWHALFVGFVFSMVFAHAQIILPALTGVRVRHSAAFYVPLTVLHLSLILRGIGDLSNLDQMRRLGGIGNAAAILIFALVIISHVGRGKSKKSTQKGGRR